jgi:hypothetical protein
MFEKVIEFSAHEDYFSIKEDYPIPAKLNIPEWYKKLNHTLNVKTIKGCMPFLDTLTSGYILKMPQDFSIKHNVKNDQGNLDSFFTYGLGGQTSIIEAKAINLNTNRSQVHSKLQLEGSPFIEKNKNLNFYKILNPWKITTPKGYSCLFISPLNNADDRFSIISGIVDTDTFQGEINFPIVINGDKYPVLDDTIKKGTPYVQVIPFKRDSWKMTLKPTKQKEIQNNRLFYELKLINYYKDKFWNKKSWR